MLLRPIEEDDWLAVHAWASQERVCRYQAWGPNTTEQTREFVWEAAKAWTSSSRTRFVYAVALDGYVVGNCELNLRGRDQGEISYGLHPDYWGKGLATTAASQLVQLGFEEHNLHRVFATCDPRNVASAAVLRRLGMSYEGRMRETMLIRDGWQVDAAWPRVAGADRPGGPAVPARMPRPPRRRPWTPSRPEPAASSHPGRCLRFAGVGGTRCGRWEVGSGRRCGS
ncbi:GNAT family N-acetyltransferase [Pseudofrankia sp. BMG5.36]|uniref:GNAT family N-acetyltransferase n=1 Tax=Pseudofrankia sp. BMG5.36 TaxID=1834512 RepID=UPI0018E3EBFD|nr:GNAT family N-acetyltransferase [Pseudofrankia sp. BMG5.36]